MTGPEYNADPLPVGGPDAAMTDQRPARDAFRGDIVDGETYDRIAVLQRRGLELQAQGLEQAAQANADYTRFAERSLALSERVAVALERIAAAISVDAEAES